MNIATRPQFPLVPVAQQRFVFPVAMTWEQFKILDSLLEDTRSVRLSYLDGHVEIMTISPDHETIKCLLTGLLMLFFVEKDISFTSTGSATLQAEEKGSSKEPDLSYRFGDDRRQRDLPDLVVEVVMTSGSIEKLEYYRRFGISEVWFWQDGILSLYYLREAGYEQISQSQVLPDLDLALLARCLQMSEEKEALKYFRNAIRGKSSSQSSELHRLGNAEAAVQEVKRQVDR